MSSIKLTLERRLAEVNYTLKKSQMILEESNKHISEVTSELMKLTKEKTEIETFLSEYSNNEAVRNNN